MIRYFSLLFLISLISLVSSFSVFPQGIKYISDKDEFEFRLLSYKDSLYSYVRDSIYFNRMYNSGYKEVSLKYFKESYKSVGKNYSKDFVHNGIEPVRFFVLDKKVQVGSCVCEGYKLVFVNFIVLRPKPVQVVRLKTPKKHIVSVDRITPIDKQKIYPMPVKEFKGFDNFDYGLDMVGDVDDSIYSDFIRLGFEEFVSFTSKGYPIYDKISKDWVLVEDGYVNLYKFK